MTVFFAEGSKTAEISDARLREIVFDTLAQLEARRGDKYKRVALVPPDFTRFHSCVLRAAWLNGESPDTDRCGRLLGFRKAGVLSQYAHEYLKDGVKDVMPALGTHVAMTDDELTRVWMRI